MYTNSYVAMHVAFLTYATILIIDVDYCIVLPCKQLHGTHLLYSFTVIISYGQYKFVDFE